MIVLGQSSTSSNALISLIGLTAARATIAKSVKLSRLLNRITTLIRYDGVDG